jgi:hypothetical protein
MKNLIQAVAQSELFRVARIFSLQAQSVPEEERSRVVIISSELDKQDDWAGDVKTLATIEEVDLGSEIHLSRHATHVLLSQALSMINCFAEALSQAETKLQDRIETERKADSDFENSLAEITATATTEIQTLKRQNAFLREQRSELEERLKIFQSAAGKKASRVIEEQICMIKSLQTDNSRLKKRIKRRGT